MSNNNMTATVEIDDLEIEKIEKKILDTLLLTAEAIHTDLVQSQTMPFDTGTLQNESTYAQMDSEGHAYVFTDTPYARRLYFHPEFNFSKEENPNAGALWFEPYTNGEKDEFIENAFIKIYKGL